MKHCRWTYFQIALISLMAGYFVYLLFRPGPAIIAIPHSIEHWRITIDWLVPLTGALPEFLHTYAFILLTYVVLGVGNKSHLFISVISWLVIEVLFELGQHPLISKFIDTVVFSADKVNSLESIVRNYFIHGTYDIYDLLAILLACITAVFTILTINPEEKQDAVF